jgi:hypothetical protein
LGKKDRKPEERPKYSSGKAGTCFLCKKPGHFANECPTKHRKEHLRATCSDDESKRENSNSSSGSNSESEYSQGREEMKGIESADNSMNSDRSDREVIESEYDYSDRDDGEIVMPMTIEETEPCNNKECVVQNYKISLQKEKEGRKRPQVPPQKKKCLTTYVRINGVDAWTLWDSGSTTTGITPTFAQVANVKVFDLLDPHILQLGTVGSRSSIKYGADITLNIGQFSADTYVDIANFDRYDMIIGVPFMTDHDILLDFKNHRVIVEDQPIPAQLMVREADARLRRH